MAAEPEVREPINGSAPGPPDSGRGPGRLWTYVQPVAFAIFLSSVFFLASDDPPRPDPLLVQDPGSDIVVPPEGTSRAVDRIRSVGVVAVAFSASAPYVVFSPPVQDFRGLGIDLQREVQNFLSDNVIQGLATRGRLLPWDEVLERVVTGEFVMAVNGPDPAGTPYEGRVVLIPLSERGWCLIARSETDYSSVDDVVGSQAIVAVVAETGPDRQLSEVGAATDVRTGPTAEVPLHDVLHGTIDAVPVDSTIAEAIVEEVHGLRFFPDSCLTDPLWPERFGLLVAADDLAWVEFASAFGASLQADDWAATRLLTILESEAFLAGLRNFAEDR